MTHTQIIRVAVPSEDEGHSAYHRVNETATGDGDTIAKASESACLCLNDTQIIRVAILTEVVGAARGAVSTRPPLPALNP